MDWFKAWLKDLDKRLKQWRRDRQPAPDPEPVCPPAPAGFCPEAYLAANEKVAADPFYKKCPQAHYIDWGKDEGRDPCPKIPPPPPSPGKYKILLEVKGRSFFSVLVLPDGRILAGDYSFPSKVSRLYQVAPRVVVDFDAGESIFCIYAEDNGRL